MPADRRMSDDASPVELGVKFNSDVNGFINGIRFYKGAGNTGTHVGNLWTSTGTLLATAMFTNESPSGWQQVLFDAPVADHGEHDLRRVVSHQRRPLLGVRRLLQQRWASIAAAACAGDRAPSAATACSATAPSAFPTQTFNATNYWVDVVFDSTPDTIAPTIADVTATADRRFDRGRHLDHRRAVDIERRLLDRRAVPARADAERLGRGLCHRAQRAADRAARARVLLPRPVHGSRRQ